MWLFGSGKKKSAPEVYVSGTTSEGFTEVNTRPPQIQTTTYESPLPPYPTLPYNLLPQVQSPYTPPYTPPKLPQTVRPPANPLDSIPFRLAKSLEQGNNVSFDIKSIQQTLNRIKENLNSDLYEYDFKLERSVIQEVDSSRG